MLEFLDEFAQTPYENFRTHDSRKMKTTDITLEQYNTIVEKLTALENAGKILKGFKWTKHGYISKLGINFGYDIVHCSTCHMIYVIWNDGDKYYNCKLNFKMYQTKELQKDVYGYQGRLFLLDEMKKHDINPETYITTDKTAAKEINDRIPESNKINGKTYIRWCSDQALKQLTYDSKILNERIIHIDINSAFLSGIAEQFPELKDWATDIYNKRKEKNNNIQIKSLINVGIGHFHCEHNCYDYAKLASAAITYCNKTVQDLMRYFESREISTLCINTDGLWLIGDAQKLNTAIQDTGKLGVNLGQFKIDHNVEKIRFISANKYEYIENGSCHVCMSGQSQLDKIKPRDEWVWGDIFLKTADIITYKLEENETIKIGGIIG